MPNMDRRDKSKGQLCVQWFNSMATDEERAVLKDRLSDLGKRRLIVSGLHALIVKRLRDAFKEEAKVEVPRELGRADHNISQLKISALHLIAHSRV